MRRHAVAWIAAGPLAFGLVAFIVAASMGLPRGPSWWSVAAYIFATLATYVLHRVLGDPLAAHDYARGYLDGHRDARKFREIFDDEEL